MKHGDAELASNRVLTKTGDHTITNLDEVIICNKSTALTITLPAATGSGKRVTIKNVGVGLATLDGHQSFGDWSDSILRPSNKRFARLVGITLFSV